MDAPPRWRAPAPPSHEARCRTLGAVAALRESRTHRGRQLNVSFSKARIGSCYVFVAGSIPPLLPDHSQAQAQRHLRIDCTSADTANSPAQRRMWAGGPARNSPVRQGRVSIRAHDPHRSGGPAPLHRHLTRKPHAREAAEVAGLRKLQEHPGWQLNVSFPDARIGFFYISLPRRASDSQVL
jgi:hypothetical protein